MIEVLRLLPFLSGAALALFSVYHVGYFSKIGMNLLGLVDATNLVYSFGVSFGLVSLLLMIFNGDTISLLRKLGPLDFLPVLVRAWNRFFLPAGLAIIFLVLIYNVFAGQPLRAGDAIAGAIFFVLSITLGAIIFLRKEREGIVHAAEVTGAAIFLFWAVYDWGRAEALNDVERSTPTYRVTLLDRSSLEHVRLIRSSSSGFIIALDGKVQFIPASQVKAVFTETAVRY